MPGCYDVDHADWLLRLLRPLEDHGDANHEGSVSTEAAEGALYAKLGVEL